MNACNSRSAKFFDGAGNPVLKSPFPFSSRSTLLALWAILASSPFAQAQQYSLGQEVNSAIPGGQYTYITGLNNYGDIVGVNATATGYENAPVNVPFAIIGGSSIDLSSIGLPVGVNDSATIIGGNASLTNGVLTAIPNLAVSAINKAGTIVGTNVSSHAATYFNGVITDLGTLGGQSSVATAINDVGVVVGDSEVAGTTPVHAFVSVNGVMTDLGTLGGANSHATAINHAGVIVGYSDIAGNSAHHAFKYANGIMTDLGTLGGPNSTARGINDSNTIVGAADLTDGSSRAFILITNGVVTDINTLVSQSLFIGSEHLLNAVAINSPGQIAVTGQLGAYVLSPNPITVQPQNKTGQEGQSVTFTASASLFPGMTGFSWIWQKNGVNISGSNTTGPTASLTLSNLTSADAASYTVTCNGRGSWISSSATLTMMLDESLNQTVTTGHDANLFAAGAVGGSAIQWQMSTDSGVTWVNVTPNNTFSGTTTDVLTITSASSALANYSFRFSATNNGGISVSNATQLNVVPIYFPHPSAITLDSTGNMYVCDSNNQTIKKVTSGGVVSLLAGSLGIAGSSNGTGASASFNQPSGISIDANGLVTVADTSNSTIRQITSAGAVSTLAGSAVNRGNMDGAGSSATFNSPIGITQTSAGTFFVADSMNNTIRSITAAGTVTTFAGNANSSGSTDATGTLAHFNTPSGIAADNAGNLYVADTTNNTVRKINSSASVTTLAGLAGVSGVTDGLGNAALFNHPSGLAIDTNGNSYVTDTGNSTIRKITPQGVVTTLAGMPGIAGMMDGTGSDAFFNQPQGLGIDTNGNLYVADTGNAALRKVTPAGVVTTIALSSAAPTITLQPVNVTVTAGSSASFTVTASGDAPISYQWLKGGNNIVGATSSSFSITVASASDAGSYTVKVSNSAGSVTSSAATLTVNAAPTPTPTPTPSGGGGGGGGAISIWFLGAISFLASVRRVFQMKK